MDDDLPADLPLRSSADTDGEVRDLLGRLESSGNDLRIIRLIANAPAVFKPFVLMSTALMAKATLPPAEREMVILYLATHRGVDYEWKEHVSMSEKAGVTQEQREAIRALRCDDIELFDADARASLRAARELTEGGSLSESTWAELIDRLGRSGALDLVFTIAWWGGFVPTVIEAFGLRGPAVK